MAGKEAGLGAEFIRRLSLLLMLALAAGILSIGTADAATPVPPWLERLNEVRANAGLEPVRERSDWSQAAAEHARYLVRHGVLDHGQDPTLADASEPGSFAARTGNLYAASFLATPTRAMHSWINSPRHARWLFQAGLREVGFGDHRDTSAAPYQYGAVLPVIDGVESGVAPPPRFTFPGNGSTLRTHPSEADAAAFRTLYLFRSDLGVGQRGRVQAHVEVDGRPWPIERFEVDDGQFAALLDRPLPADGEVEVEVMFTDRPDDRWRFRLTSDGVAHGPQGHDDGAPGSVGGPTSLAQGFSDVSGSAHRDAIGRIAAAGLVRGFGDNTFRPTENISRGQLSTILAKLLDAAPSNASIVPSDAEASVHADGIAVALDLGWMAGYPDATFRPAAAVTRGELAATLTAALDLASPSSLAPALTDVAASPHAEGIRALVAAGLARGYPDHTFRPEQDVTRGQLATVLVGVLDRS